MRKHKRVGHSSTLQFKWKKVPQGCLQQISRDQVVQSSTQTHTCVHLRRCKWAAHLQPRVHTSVLVTATDSTSAKLAGNDEWQAGQYTEQQHTNNTHARTNVINSWSNHCISEQIKWSRKTCPNVLLATSEAFLGSIFLLLSVYILIFNNPLFSWAWADNRHHHPARSRAGLFAMLFLAADRWDSLAAVCHSPWQITYYPWLWRACLACLGYHPGSNGTQGRQ